MSERDEIAALLDGRLTIDEIRVELERRYGPYPSDWVELVDADEVMIMGPDELIFGKCKPQP